jgi:hypothetical protein
LNFNSERLTLVPIVSTENAFQAVSEILDEPGDEVRTEDFEPEAGIRERSGGGGGGGGGGRARTTTRRSDGCKAARAMLQDAREERHIWGWLVIIVGIAAALTVAYLIMQLTDLSTNVDKVKAAAAAGGTIISGGLATWIVKRFNDAKKEEHDWADLIDKRCKTA